ncbi:MULTISPECIES: sugar transferase [unclassified Microcoleus]|uniref:sugar transferase n=1 Tax=unclassified Microcoleus TaxID=2642155 RepID=UPI002FD67F17
MLNKTDTNSNQIKSNVNLYLLFGKRLFDFTAAFLGLLILAIPIGTIAIIILVTDGRPILFTQQRVGQEGKLFQIKKFRTMYVRQEGDSTITVAGDRRITPIGAYLRRWKLDELPQLWNVMVGEMSFVGPRPDVPGYADKLEGDERKLLLLRPGITGPATLAYRNEEGILANVSDPIQYNNEVIYPEKVRLNLEYLKEASFFKDLAYIYQTIVD